MRYRHQIIRPAVDARAAGRERVDLGPPGESLGESCGKTGTAPNNLIGSGELLYFIKYGIGKTGMPTNLCLSVGQTEITQNNRTDVCIHGLTFKVATTLPAK